MTTWKVSLRSVFNCDSEFRLISNALTMRSYRSLFRKHGFTVHETDREYTISITVSHPSEHAMTVFALKHLDSKITVEKL